MTRRVGIALLVTLSFVAGTFVPVVRSQGPIQGTGEFVVVNYMKVPPGGAAAYVALERDLYKASHQARVKDGKLKSWSLWQQWFGGSEDPYSFITINTYNRRLG